MFFNKLPMKQNYVALVGLAVMGQNLARNIVSHGFSLAVYNRTSSVTDAFLEKYANDFLSWFHDIGSMVASLSTPRKIIVMVKAWEAVDSVISELLPHLESWDLIIDAGNSFYRDTIRRQTSLKEKEIHFVGCWVSGGEYGALTGPSMMPWCEKDVYQFVYPLFHAISAYDYSWGKCVTYIWADGAGHFVKMVHNGIEYAMMQMIAEGYDILRKIFHLSPPEIASVFERFQRGRLQSYLIDITARVLKETDAFHEWEFLIDFILDSAWAKGTGKWTSQEGVELSESVSTIIEATHARDLSQKKSLRSHLWDVYCDLAVTSWESLETFLEKLEPSLYLGMITAYAQGFALIQTRAKTLGWNIHLAEIARIWQWGCIIRAKLLESLETNFRIHPDIEHLYELTGIVTAFEEWIDGYCDTLSFAIKHRVPTPSLSSALEYFFTLTTPSSSTNLIQAQRDYFWAHTYQRSDRAWVFHTQWDFED